VEPRKLIVNGAELHYVEQGTGDPVVFVHGSLGDFRSWRFQVEPFAARYRVIAYSRRYHYPNAWSGDGSDYSAALHAQDLAGLIQALGLESAHVVASSYGAYTSLFLAVQHPQLVRTLVLGEPPILSWLEHVPGGNAELEAFMSGAWEPARRAFQSGDLEEGVKAFVDGVMGKGTFDQFPPPARSNMMDNAREMKAETAASEYFPALTCEDVGQIQAPMLLLTGEQSPRMFHLIVDELERCLSNKQRATIPNASHAMHIGNPQAYNAAVLAFLAKH